MRHNSFNPYLGTLAVIGIAASGLFCTVNSASADPAKPSTTQVVNSKFETPLTFTKADPDNPLITKALEIYDENTETPAMLAYSAGQFKRARALPYECDLASVAMPPNPIASQDRFPQTGMRGKPTTEPFETMVLDKDYVYRRGSTLSIYDGSKKLALMDSTFGEKAKAAGKQRNLVEIPISLVQPIEDTMHWNRIIVRSNNPDVPISLKRESRFGNLYLSAKPTYEQSKTLVIAVEGEITYQNYDPKKAAEFVAAINKQHPSADTHDSSGAPTKPLQAPLFRENLDISYRGYGLQDPGFLAILRDQKLIMDPAQLATKSGFERLDYSLRNIQRLKIFLSEPGRRPIQAAKAFGGDCSDTAAIAFAAMDGNGLPTQTMCGHTSGDGDMHSAFIVQTFDPDGNPITIQGDGLLRGPNRTMEEFLEEATKAGMISTSLGSAWGYTVNGRTLISDRTGKGRSGMVSTGAGGPNDIEFNSTYLSYYNTSLATEVIRAH